MFTSFLVKPLIKIETSSFEYKFALVLVSNYNFKLILKLFKITY